MRDRSGTSVRSPLGGWRSSQPGRRRAYTEQSHASTVESSFSNSSQYFSVCESRERRPFVQQADRLQQDFDYDFASYLDHLEQKMAGGSETSRINTGRCCQTYARAKIPDSTPSWDIEVVKTLELGPKKKMSMLFNFVRCDGHGGIRSTARSWMNYTGKIANHWAGVHGARPSDITNSSLRSAMALPEARAEQQLPSIRWRDMGAAERSLMDRTPRTNPECTRRPPQTARSTQALDRSESPASRLPSPRLKNRSLSPQRVTFEGSADMGYPRSVIQSDPQSLPFSADRSVVPRLQRRLTTKVRTC